MRVGLIRKMSRGSTLLTQIGLARQSVARQPDAVPSVFGFCVLHTVATLYCATGVEENRGWLSTAIDVDRILRTISVRPYEHVSSVECSGDGTVVADTCASCPCECRRSLSESFEFSHEETWVRWLIVAFCLPHHCLTILVVVPKRLHAVLGRSHSGIDTDEAVVGSSHHQFLAPVAENVTRCTWVLLRAVDTCRSV